MIKTGFIFLVLLLLGCEKPNPTPEVGDAIYSDLSSQASTTEKAVEAEKKKLEGLRKEVSLAKPYTGELKSAQRRFFESEKKLQQLIQEKYYYSLRARSRKEAVRRAYAKSFAEKKVWDSTEESKSYTEFQRISKVPLSWDSKRRIANYEKETGFSVSSKNQSAPAAAPAASKGH